MFLYDIFTRLLAKICLNASFIGLSRFIAVCVTSNDFMVLNATLWLTVTHTFKGSRRKLAHWSK